MFPALGCSLHHSLTYPCNDYLQTSQALPILVSEQEQDRLGSAGLKSLRLLAFLGAGVSGLLSCATVAYSSDEAEHGLECPSYPWPHRGILSSYDHAS